MRASVQCICVGVGRAAFSISVWAVGVLRAWANTNAVKIVWHECEKPAPRAC